MHVVDALISPAVGASMWAATVGIAAYASKKIDIETGKEKIPLMGVMGAFVFAMQMVNFSIPGTGSSGHIVGGIMLAALLGSNAGFLSMISILSIQALFFADGGLFALGANIFNLGFFTCYIAYPLLFRSIVKNGYSVNRIIIGSMLACIAGLQLGSLGVVLQTVISGKTLLSFSLFASIMQPIHLVIGAVEGIITAAILTFIYKQRPEIMDANIIIQKKIGTNKKATAVLLAAALIVAGTAAIAASADPDGLEWSLQKAGQSEALVLEEDSSLEQIQQSSSIFPEYKFREDGVAVSQNGQTGIAGIIGAALTLAFAVLIGFIIWLIKKKKRKKVAVQGG